MGKELSTAVFDYSQVEKDEKGKLIALAGQLKKHTESLRRAAIDIKAIVAEAHEILASKRAGLFDEWIELETDVGRSTAYNCLNVEKRAVNYPILDNLPPTVAYLLAGPKVPDEAIEDFQKQIDKGVKPTVAAAKETLAKFRTAVNKPPPAEDLGKCPNCAGKRWKKQDDGATVCAKCGHPHGEPTGGTDADRLADQRSKTVKTVEAALRAFDDLHMLQAKPDEHTEAIASCKFLLKTAKGWK